MVTGDEVLSWKVEGETLNKPYHPSDDIQRGHLRGWRLLPECNQDQVWGHRHDDGLVAAVPCEDKSGQHLRCPQCGDPVPAPLEALIKH
jgi:hypothetical protein